MSKWGAIEPFGEAVTSYEFRDEYLRDDIEHDRHFCPFCGIPLIPVRIYKDGKSGKTPHFRTHKGSRHIPPCDGAPEYSHSPSAQNPPLRSVDKTKLHFPEELIEPRKISVVHRPTKGDTTGRNTPEEICRRREAAQSLGPARYRTSLLREIAEAFLNVLSEFGYRRKAEGEDSAQKWLKETLNALPLTLYGVKRTYRDGIQKTCFLTSGANPERIFRSSGIPDLFQDAIKIPSEDPVKINGQDVPVVILVHKTLLQEPSMKSSWTKTMNRLQDASRNSKRISWFCYGKMEKEEGQYNILIDRWDHLYIRE